MAETPTNHAGKAFIEDVMARLAITKPRDLARLLGWVGTDRAGKLYVWRAGKSAPNFAGTIALLNQAGLLRDDPIVRDLLDRLELVAVTPERVAELRGLAEKELDEVRSRRRARPLEGTP